MDYSEKQKLNRIKVMLIGGAMSLIILAAIFTSVGNLRSEDMDWWLLVFVALIPLLAMGTVFYLFFTSELETSINSIGFTYRYFPFVRNEKHLNFDEVKTWRIGDRKELFFKVSSGYKNSWIRKRISIILDGNEYIEMKMNNGMTYLFSTTNSFGLSAAMRKHISKKELNN